MLPFLYSVIDDSAEQSTMQSSSETGELGNPEAINYLKRECHWKRFLETGRFGRGTNTTYRAG